jgi:hypothetical protein
MPRQNNLLSLYARLKLVQEKISSFPELATISNNPYFVIGKATPRHFREFSFLMSKTPLFSLLRNLVFLPFYILYRSLFEALRNTVSRLLYSKTEFERKQTDVIILSHRTSQSLSPNPIDSFFGELGEYLSKTSKVAKIYLPNESLFASWKHRNSKEASPIFRRDIRFSAFSLILLKNIVRVVRIVRVTLIKGNLSVETRLFLSYAAFKQMSRGSFNDLIIAEELKEIVKIKSPHTVIITYEGHPVELTLLIELSSRFSSLRLIAYQHAPIAPSQLGFFKGLPLFSGNIFLATSGELPKQIVTKAHPGIESNVIVLGSPKHLGGGKPKKLKTHEEHIRILIAPEASLEAVSEGIKGAAIFLNKSEKSELTLRLHPRLQDNSIEVSELLDTHFELTISTRSLRLDLQHSDICVYRSSAVFLQGMQLGVIPFYYSAIPHQLLDPLYLVSNMGKLGPLLGSFYSEQTGLQARKLLKDKDAIKAMQEFGLEYFSAFSIKTVTWLSLP